MMKVFMESKKKGRLLDIPKEEIFGSNEAEQLNEDFAS